jgi:hypothetical protein
MLSMSSWLLVESWTDAPCEGPSIFCLVDFITHCRANGYPRTYSCVTRR